MNHSYFYRGFFKGDKALGQAAVKLENFNNRSMVHECVDVRCWCPLSFVIATVPPWSRKNCLNAAHYLTDVFHYVAVVFFQSSDSSVVYTTYSSNETRLTFTLSRSHHRFLFMVAYWILTESAHDIIGMIIVWPFIVGSPLKNCESLLTAKRLKSSFSF